MKNDKHSKLAIELNRAKEQYSWYLNGVIITKQSLMCSYQDPYEVDSISELKGNLSDERYMIIVLQKEIRKLKHEIRKVQREYSINHANQQPSQPLTKLEGSETNS